MGLQRYKEKRNFRMTPEPAGKVRPKKRGALSFVIQKHEASRLHYDFRLELAGVLLSWAVPKGIPTNKGDRRLAMHVEDHPLDYGGFEGVIPEGNYGAGTVMLWDNGTWESMGGEPAEDLRAGKLHFVLHGQKLQGEWTLVRMSRSEKDEWLLIKSGEDVPAIRPEDDDRSVATNRTMAEIAGQRTDTWQSNRTTTPAKGSVKARIAAAKKRAETQTAKAKSPAPERKLLESTLTKCPAEAPRFLEPMKARLVEKLPREDLLIELKHDGYRALAVKDGAEVKLYSRSHRDMTHEFPAIVAAVQRLTPKQAVIDGEIVALNKEGHGSFQLLQNREQIRDEGALVFYAFDVLNLDGRNVRDLPLVQRRELVEPLIASAGEPLLFSPSLNGTPEVVLGEVKRLGLEGIIAKKPDSKYEVGRRSGAWIKLKCVNEQEFVVGGYTPPKGSRDFFGALIVGYYEDGKLMFASKVGSGYSQAILRDLNKKFEPFRQKTCPFANLPTKRGGKFGQGISASEMKHCTWLKPHFVAQVRFTEWTDDGGLRHPVFLGLRDDKPPHEVRKEMPA